MLLFSLHKVKTHVQSAPTTKPCNTGLEGGSGSTFKSHKTFLGNQHGLSYKLTKSDLGVNRDRAQPGGNAYFVSGANLLH